MGNPEKVNPDPFEIRRIRQLVELMKDNDLSEINLQQGETRIQMCRSVTTSVTSGFAQAPSPTSFSQPITPASVLPAQEDASHFVVIKSPMVGTFYAANDPESPPFVKVGDVVFPEKTVCIIEAMKVFNEIQAEVSGRIVSILVANGEPVEFGKPLFKIDTRS